MSVLRFDPAGRDERLSAACTDVRSGILGAVREVLAETRYARNFARRGYASALLGALAADTNLAELWVVDAPSDPDALLLAARVSTVRAVRAVRENPRRARRPVEEAMKSIHAAGIAWPDDPTPSVVMLALLKHHHGEAVGESTLPELAGLRGPWQLVERDIWPRDPFNRETGRHLLEYFAPRHGGSNEQMARVAEALAQWSPEHSPLRLLPLAAFIEAEPDPELEAARKADRFNRVDEINKLISKTAQEYQKASAARDKARVDQDGRLAPDPVDVGERIAKLQREAALEHGALAGDSRKFPYFLGQDIDELFAAWFLADGGLDPQGPTGYLPLADLSLLALGLKLAGKTGYAATVFRRLRPFATRYPWSLYGDPAAVLDETLAELRAAGEWTG